MNPDSPSPGDEPGGSPHPPQPGPWPPPTVTYSYDAQPRRATLTYSAREAAPPEPPWRTEHDREQGIFRLTGPDGQTECFRSQPARFLVVEPDPQTGEFRPQIRQGEPRILH